MREGRKREREREVICSEMGIEREKQIRKNGERERMYVKVVERNNKKIEKNEYFIEISCKIDKLM